MRNRTGVPNKCKWLTLQKQYDFFFFFFLNAEHCAMSSKRKTAHAILESTTFSSIEGK